MNIPSATHVAATITLHAQSFRVEQFQGVLAGCEVCNSCCVLEHVPVGPADGMLAVILRTLSLGGLK